MTTSSKQTHTDKFEMIGRISAGLAHELNGPIGIALGFTELAKESIAASGSGGLDGQSAAKLVEYLNLIESSTRRARELARNVWDFAKAEPGTVEQLDLSEMVSHAAALAGPAVKIGSLEIIQRGEISEVMVNADKALTQQALVLLMLSTVETLPKGGTVYWEVRSVEAEGERGGEFTLTAEPWGEVPSNEWPVDDQVRAAFESQGGSMDPVTGVSMKSGGSSALAWIVSGTLPAAPN
jgi:signal transduction histidine kinase